MRWRGRSVGGRIAVRRASVNPAGQRARAFTAYYGFFLGMSQTWRDLFRNFGVQDCDDPSKEGVCLRRVVRICWKETFSRQPASLRQRCERGRNPLRIVGCPGCGGPMGKKEKGNYCATVEPPDAEIR